MFEWLSNLFSSSSGHDENKDLTMSELESDSSFVFNEHMRIILAIVIMLLGAGVMWWIVA